jgi:integrase
MPLNNPKQPSSSSSFLKATERFFAYLEKEKGFSGHTLKAYRQDIDQFTGFLHTQNIPLSLEKAIEKKALRAFTFSLSRKQLRPRTIARKIAALKSFSRFCARRNLVQHNAAKLLSAPKIDKQLPVFLTRRQTASLPRRQTAPFISCAITPSSSFFTAAASGSPNSKHSLSTQSIRATQQCGSWEKAARSGSFLLP